jgi:phospholipase/carboxylesterase
VIAAAYPLSGWLPPSLRPSSTASSRPSLLALHGTGDERVPIEESRETVARLVAAGYHAALHEYPGMPHTVGSAERRELYQALQASIDARK